MIPIIPLRKVHVIEECPSCRRHGVMNWSQWESAQQRTAQTFVAYRASPRNADLAKEALAACAAHRNRQALMEIGPEIEKGMAWDAKSLSLLASAYDFFGQKADAERTLRAALALKQEDESVREALAECLMDQGRPAEAQPLLQHIVQKGIPDRVNHLYRLAQGYQIIGEHDTALAIFQQCETINPAVAEDQTFQRLQNASAEKRGTRVAVQPSKILQKAKRAEGMRKFMKVAPVVIVLALAGYALLSLIEGRRQLVYLVNGLDKPYSVSINGTTYLLPPQSHMLYRLGQGDLNIQPVDKIAGSAQTGSMRTPFLSRPFTSHTFIINPDRTAILRRSQVFYSVGGTTPSSNTYFAGQAVYDFPGLDYNFEEMPHSLKLESNSSEVSKIGLYLVGAGRSVDPATMLIGLSNEIGASKAVDIARRRLDADPAQVDYLKVLEAQMPSQELGDYLRGGLAARPVRMEWHRVYQEVMSRAGADDQIETDYNAMLAAEPGNTDLIYLTGRATRNMPKRVALFQKAAAADCGYAQYSLAMYYLANGQTTPAADAASKSMQLLRGDWQIVMRGRYALMADGRFDDALKSAAAQEMDPLPAGFYAYLDEIYIQNQRGKRAEVETAIQLLKGTVTRGTNETFESAENRLRADLDYANGNASSFAKRNLSAHNPGDRFKAQLTQGDLAAAERDLRLLPNDADAQLLFYIAAASKNRTDLAAPHLKAAIDLLRQEEFDERQFAAALEGTGKMPLADVLELTDSPEQKMLIVTALGLHDPSARDACFALGRKLLYDKRFPYLLIAPILGK
jgi:tetratricopeptide (TPR) repeat protein